jgi:MFS family permease
MRPAPAAVWRGHTELTASFADGRFRALWTAGALSSVAQWTLLTGRSWLAHELTGGSGAVGLVVFAQMLPYVFVPPVGGLLADRFNRRTVVTGTLMVSFLSALVMALLTLADLVTVWQLFLLSLINGTARSVEMPASQAMVPALVPPERLLNAVALTGVVTHGSRLLGPLITLLVLGPFGAGGAFLAAALLYLGGLVQLRQVPRPVQAAMPAGEGPLRQLAGGLGAAAREPVIGMILLLVLFHCGLTMSYDALMPAYANDHMGHGDNAFSLLMMAVGGGSMLGTVALAGMSLRWHRGRLLLLSGLVSGLAPALLALAPGRSAAVGAALTMGAAQAMFMALTNAALQTITPDRYRGRVLSLFLMIGGGVMAFGNLAAGYLADRWGTLPVLLIPSLAFVAVMLVSTAGTTLRGVYRLRALPAAP